MSSKSQLRRSRSNLKLQINWDVEFPSNEQRRSLSQIGVLSRGSWQQGCNGIGKSLSIMKLLWCTKRKPTHDWTLVSETFFLNVWSASQISWGCLLPAHSHLKSTQTCGVFWRNLSVHGSPEHASTDDHTKQPLMRFLAFPTCANLVLQMHFCTCVSLRASCKNLFAQCSMVLLLTLDIGCQGQSDEAGRHGRVLP